MSPAFCAGEPSTTALTSAPRGAGRWKLLARSGVTSWIVTPSQPRVTWPVEASCVRTGFARAIGIANPIPTEPPLRVKIALLIPMAWPRVLMSGPPLLPGLIDASVWMKLSYGPSPITRPVALTMPVVTVCSRPKGLPIAITGSPTWSCAESPSGTTGSPRASTFRRARSVFGSRPRTFAGHSRPSESLTLISVAPSTTWLFVTMYPSGLTMKPEPRLRTVRRAWLPKNCLKNSLNGSSLPNGLSTLAPDSTRLVLMLTTAGFRSRASATHGEDGAVTGGVDVSGRSVHRGTEVLAVKPKRGTTATRATAATVARAPVTHRHPDLLDLIASLLFLSERSGGR